MEVIVKYEDEKKPLKIKNGSYIRDIVKCIECKNNDGRGKRHVVCSKHPSATSPEFFCADGER